MGKNIVTRKMQLLIDAENKEEWKEKFQKLNDWAYNCQKGANMVASRLFAFASMQYEDYLTDKGRRFVLKKDEAINTSLQNVGYRLLSKQYKGEMPSDIFSNLNSIIFNTFNKEKSDVIAGYKSLRSYKRSIPMPFSAKSIRNLRQTTVISEADGQRYNNWTFDWLGGISFNIKLGTDKANNRIILDRILAGEYVLKNSSIQIKEEGNSPTSKNTSKKIYLLAVVEIPKIKHKAIENRTVEAKLDIDTPIVAKCYKYKKEIGNKEEFLYRRRQIQETYRRKQKGLKYTKGGHGRKTKLKPLYEFYKNLEQKYIADRLHNYSSELIKFALHSKAEKILLKDVPASKKELDDFTIRNWSYHDLLQKIEYKAKKVGITVEVENEDYNKNQLLKGLKHADLKKICEALDIIFEKYHVKSMKKELQNLEYKELKRGYDKVFS